MSRTTPSSAPAPSSWCARAACRAPRWRATWASTSRRSRLWVKQAEIDAGRRDGLTTDERAELARLRREIAVLREEREILKKAARFFAIESATR